MSNIPLARKLLSDLLPELPEPMQHRVGGILALLTRRPPSHPRAPTTSSVMTPEKGAAIRAYKAAFPEAPNDRIAAIFHVNAGRVSEALRGEW